MKRLTTYFTVWKMLATHSWQETFINRGTNFLFFLGKVVRFSMTLAFLWVIKNNLKLIGGYSTDQMVVFFLTYTFVDVASQAIFRGVYIFSNIIRSGEFDMLLLKPINPLFQSLVGLPDINDVLFLIPSTIVSAIILSSLSISFSWYSWLIFGCLIFNALLVSASLHILVLSIGVITTEADNTIWMLRELSRLGQFPVTIYQKPVQLILFFLIPIGIMMTIPAQVLAGLTPSYALGIVFGVGVGSLAVSIQFWKWSLKKYSGVGS